MSRPSRAAVETGVLYCEDNLVRLTQMPAESVDLIYLDPPFFSNRVYEVIWGDEAEVRSFEDRWEGGIQVYVDWMRRRVVQMHRVLKPNGALYLHCDPHASHYLKIMLDEAFGGASYFRNELVWKRTTSHSSAKRYAPVHDLIFYYAKGDSPTWTDHRLDYDDEYVAAKYRDDDGDGRRYTKSDLTAAGIRHGRSGLPWRGFDPATKGNHWKFTIDRLDELDSDGRIYWPRNGGWPRYKRYLDEVKGLAMPDVWTDIDALNSMSRERLGYPTQKPEALLERILLASSNENDVVLDPFCGCGTTVTVAERLKRKWIGIDISPTAVNLMIRRLSKSTSGLCKPTVIGMPAAEDELRALKPFEFQNWVMAKSWATAAPRKSGDMGIDGYSFMVNDPIQVKQSDGVGRNVVDNFETAMRRAGASRGYIVAFSFTRNAREEVARARVQEGLDIQLVTVKALLEAKDDERGPLVPKGATITELPLNPPKTGKALPSAEELVASDKATVASA